MIEQYLPWVLLYLLGDFITLFVLIQVYKRQFIYQDMEKALPEMWWLSVVWPYVLILWVLSWEIFTWQFWLRPVPELKSPSPWWINK